MAGRMNDCPFCPDNWPQLDVVADVTNIEGHRVLIINPLNPVTKGHLLVINEIHTDSAAADPRIAAELMRTAAWWVRRTARSANIITSIGTPATQTVFHTHLHIVPRRLDDGLALPWTGQE